MENITIQILKSSYLEHLNETASRLFAGVCDMFDDLITEYNKNIERIKSSRKLTPIGQNEEFSKIAERAYNALVDLKAKKNFDYYIELERAKLVPEAKSSEQSVVNELRAREVRDYLTKSGMSDFEIQAKHNDDLLRPGAFSDAILNDPTPRQLVPQEFYEHIQQVRLQRIDPDAYAAMENYQAAQNGLEAVFKECVAHISDYFRPDEIEKAASSGG